MTTFDDFYESSWTEACRLALGVLGGDRSRAEEVAQDAFAECWKRWETIQNPQGYLRRSVCNRAIDVSSRDRRRMSLLRQYRPGRHTVDDPVPLDDLLAAIRPEFRAVLVLRFWAGLREAEVAQTLGISSGTVKTWTRRALQQLRRQLQEDESSARTDPDSAATTSNPRPLVAQQKEERG